jgi:formate dehydrogenase subunit gamma
MMRSLWCKRLLPLTAILLALALSPAIHAADLSDAKEQAQRQQVQPGNNAPFWRDVREGTRETTNPYQTTQVRGVETNVLVQPSGQSWRQLRPPVSLAGGLLIAAALLAVFAFYHWRGPISVHDQATGRLIKRFSDAERFTHWTVAISVCVLAVTGLIITFGKYALLPVLGYTLFSWIAILAKNLHNFVAPVFLFALPVMIVLFIRDNFPERGDWQWLTSFGGLFSKSSRETPSGRFNLGEKVLFWLMVCALGLILAVSGTILLFPNFDQGRELMQTANIVHVAGAMLMIFLASFHIYLGTVGMRGAYPAMRTGYVDETWAKEHHQLWYEQVKAGKARQHFADDAPADVRSQVADGLKAQ